MLLRVGRNKSHSYTSSGNKLTMIFHKAVTEPLNCECLDPLIPLFRIYSKHITRDKIKTTHKHLVIQVNTQDTEPQAGRNTELQCGWVCPAPNTQWLDCCRMCLQLWALFSVWSKSFINTVSYCSQPGRGEKSGFSIPAECQKRSNVFTFTWDVGFFGNFRMHVWFSQSAEFFKETSTDLGECVLSLQRPGVLYVFRGFFG